METQQNHLALSLNREAWKIRGVWPPSSGGDAANLKGSTHTLEGSRTHSDS